MRRSSAQSGLLVAFGAAVVLFIVGALTFTIFDNVGMPKQQNLGQITEIVYRPSYTTGSSDNRTHHSASWKVYVQTPIGKDYVRRSWMPPGWMHEGAYVRATYHLGRFSHSVSVDKIEQIK